MHIANLTPSVPLAHASYSASDPFLRLRPALAILIIRERVLGNVDDWVEAYHAEMCTSHHEEVAYEIYQLENKHQNIGLGRVGEFENPLSETEFLELVKDKEK